jgi:MOSC domain-containing protein YiiM
MVRRLNIDGDGQGDLAGHGGEHRAVFIYQIDSYRYWQNHLAEATSLSENSGRISLSKVYPMTRCASAIITVSAALFSR